MHVDAASDGDANGLSRRRGTGAAVSPDAGSVRAIRGHIERNQRVEQPGDGLVQTNDLRVLSISERGPHLLTGRRGRFSRSSATSLRATADWPSSAVVSGAFNRASILWSDSSTSPSRRCVHRPRRLRAGHRRRGRSSLTRAGGGRVGGMAHEGGLHRSTRPYVDAPVELTCCATDLTEALRAWSSGRRGGSSIGSSKYEGASLMHDLNGPMAR